MNDGDEHTDERVETRCDGSEPAGNAATDEPISTADTGEQTVDTTLEDLFAVIEDRKAELPEGSYTAALFTHEKGENAVLEKLGEETTELVLAAKDDNHEEIAYEAADIVYHLLVLLSMKEMELSDLQTELESRR